jgi:hypothetical protein
LSFEGFFVYLRSEEGRVSGKPSSKGKGKTSGEKKQGGQKEDAQNALMTSRGRKETSEEPSSKEKVVEIIKHGVIEKKVFVAQEKSEEKSDEQNEKKD